MLADIELDDMLESSLTGVEGLEWNQGRFKNYDLTRLLSSMNAFFTNNLTEIVWDVYWI